MHKNCDANIFQLWLSRQATSKVAVSTDKFSVFYRCGCDQILGTKENAVRLVPQPFCYILFGDRRTNLKNPAHVDINFADLYLLENSRSFNKKVLGLQETVTVSQSRVHSGDIWPNFVTR